MRTLLINLLTVVLVGLMLMGCENVPTNSDANKSIGFGADEDLRMLNASPGGNMSAPAPALSVAVDLGGTSYDFWPYTGTNFSGTPQDPINLIFYGEADPRQIRSALFSLDGDRTAFGFPDEYPFNVTWDDAIGDVQSAYSADKGWTGGEVQLTCGDYGPVRIHIRLFKMGDWTVGNAHFEVLIPGTSDHQVLHWEMAKQLVTADMARTGLLGAAPAETELINEPNFRLIPSMVYNVLPIELKFALGGPTDPVDFDIPIAGNGKANVLYLAGAIPPTPEVRIKDFIIDFDQAIPRPFCSSSPYDFVYVTGPVHLYQETELTVEGKYIMNFHAEGELNVIPVNPLDPTWTGNPLTAIVKEQHASRLDDKSGAASSFLFQKMVPASAEDAGWLYKRLRIGSNVNNFYENIRCVNEAGSL